MRGEGAGGKHGLEKRCRIHILEQPWRKYHGKPGGGDGVRVTCSRDRGETTGADERGFGDDGMEMGDAQVYG